MTNGRLALVQEAVRPALKARMLLMGPPGSGKTLTGLEIAGTLAEGGPVLVMDTERADAQNYAALTFADWFEARFGYKFRHLPWHPPYDPRELAHVLAEASGDYAVLMVDSMAHFWRKEGGTLDIAEGRFTGWKVARPAQDELIDAILAAESHVLLCVRSKIEYTQEQGDNGKQVVKKLGMAAMQDDTLEYEVNVALQMDMEHRTTITKSRCIELPVGAYYQPNRASDLAKVYGTWLKSGRPVAKQTEVDALVSTLNSIADKEARRDAKQAFVATFGDPNTLEAAKLEDAQKWVAKRVAEAPLPPPEKPEGGGTEPPSEETAGDTSVEEEGPRAERSSPPPPPPVEDGGFGPGDTDFEPPSKGPVDVPMEACPHPWPWTRKGKTIYCGGAIPCRLYVGGLPADEETARKLFAEKQAQASAAQPTLG
jgi:hypothetical protein